MERRDFARITGLTGLAAGIPTGAQAATASSPSLISVIPIVRNRPVFEVTVDPTALPRRRHVEAAERSEDNVLDEFVNFEFDSAQQVRRVLLSLATLGATSVANGLVFTVNAGDYAEAATRLYLGYPDVDFVVSNETVDICVTSPSVIYSVATIARASGIANASASTATIFCRGFGIEPA